MQSGMSLLPKSARFVISGWELIINNHRIVSDGGLFCWILDVIREGSCKQIVSTLQKNGISFETVRKKCIEEIRQDSSTLLHIMWWYCGIREEWSTVSRYADSANGTEMAQYIIKVIKECGNWERFCDTMNAKSDFSVKIKQKIMEEIK